MGTDTSRWIALDVGETLVDESRVWSTWAEVLGVPPLTFMAVFGVVIAGGGTHQDVFPALGFPAWRGRWPEVEERYGGFRADDLYPDAVPSMAALRGAGYRVAVIGNQPALRTAQLRSAGVEADVIAMSGELGVAKPDPAFFARALARLGDPRPSDVAYVGDRVDNDVLPAASAGLRAVWLRRGPWGLLQAPPPDGVPALVVASLAELVERAGEAFPVLPRGPVGG